MAVPAAVAAVAEVIGQVLDTIMKYYQVIEAIRSAGDKMLGPEGQTVMRMHHQKE
ncbi:MAG TPA: hypothetical protein VGV59_10950 [Pyrinomonadaceae bacterium]|nr:hypothetical protein [Pyrinomonadaceae bacterium]